ncbi:alcohol dehydrogenase class III [Hyaloraphidium curvatum]|nr:alcohol dehydrogenase class III [Hyaloraphidium curvatum]
MPSGDAAPVVTSTAPTPKGDELTFPFKCRAAVLTAYKTPLQVVDIELDEPKPTECLVRVATAGICLSDEHIIKGDWAVTPETDPHILGHEGSGVIVKTGSAVTRVKEGDHVVLLFKHACGRCGECQTGRPMICQGHNGRAPGTLLDGTRRAKLAKSGASCLHMAGLACYGEYAVIDQEQLLPIDKSIPLDRAALVGCSVMTGVGAAMNTAKVEPGSSVVVFGCGGVGLNIIQGARMLSAGKIIGVDLLPQKLEYAKQFGATHVIDGGKEDAVARIRELTGGAGADYAFDAIGLGKVLEQCFQAIRVGGTAVEVGVSPITMTASIPTFQLSMQEKILKGSFYGSARPALDMIRILDLYQQKKVMLDELVSKVYTLDSINEGFEALRKGEVARGIVKFFQE